LTSRAHLVPVVARQGVAAHPSREMVATLASLRDPGYFVNDISEHPLVCPREYR
jgi:hypothetical protein